jgi:hypothetical protein
MFRWLDQWSAIEAQAGITAPDRVTTPTVRLGGI